MSVLRSEHCRCTRDDLHEALAAQLASDRPEDTGADRIELVVEKDRRVAVETDQRAVRTTHTLGGTDHHGVVHLALLHLATRDGILHGDLDHVTDRGVTALGAAEHLDAHQFLRTAVVRRGKRALHLDHVCTLPLADRASDDFDHAVMLGLGQRAAFRDAHQVALVCTEVVLRMQLGRPAEDLAQQAVLHLALDQDGHRLVHLVADDAALEGARLLFVIAHVRRPYFLPPSANFARAISRRTRRSWCGWLSWPVPFCMRRLNCSLRRSSRCCFSSSAVLLIRSFMAITSPLGIRTGSAPTAWRRRGGTPHGPWLRRRPRFHRACGRAGSERPSTRRHPYPRPFGLRSASW